ncbi:hypothetical protein [Geotalea uraniireducens]|uniref:Uncharacterized protein n=1 Tax=Geotalea uraniireducens (strain Rf4) TaxID=351605 RepID=A5GFG8_GEOUR|nr:hypothetical protein [Geotalea uraniireducens]ABQ26173.1 hypothetical protein Gura_1983 [Geotalea uraniireducens Rf4]
MNLTEKGRKGGWLVCGVCFVLSAALPAYGGMGASEGKDLCLLYGENCPDRKETIIEIIARLKYEIARGEAVYTRKELERLQRKLDDYEWLLFVILYGSPR